MKINLNPKNSTTFERSSEDTYKRIRFYYKILNLFCEEHDISGSEIIHTQPNIVKMLTKWLFDQGWNVKYWQIDNFDNDQEPLCAWGIEFDDKCPKFIELKLKDWEYT